MAGIGKVPCRIVSNIDKRQQVSIMLEENMQRSDLTILEQAEGFQLMLDLGDTVEGIREKTGFSKSTIYHRLNIAKLDRGTLKCKEEDEGFQLSITDLYELERIRDVGKRNEVLARAVDGRNLKYLVDDAVRTEEREHIAAEVMEILKAQGMSPAPDDAWEKMYKTYKLVESISLDIEDYEEGIPEVEEYGCGAEELMYLARPQYVYVIREKTLMEEGESPEDAARRNREANKLRIDRIVKEMHARKSDFIKSIVNGDVEPIRESVELYAEMWRCMLAIRTKVERETIYDFFAEKPWWALTEKEKGELDKKIDGLTTLQQMLLVMDNSLLMYDLYNYDGTFSRYNAEKLGQIYPILEKYGWSFTEDEARLMDGTHELYAGGEDS